MKNFTNIQFLNRLKLVNAVRFYYYRYNLLTKKALTFYQQFIQPGDLCFDIGANIGVKTDIFLRLGAKVIAVEPQKECCDFILRHCKNGNLTVINKAVDAIIGYKDFWQSEANALSTLSQEWIASVKQSGRYSDFQWKNTFKVQTTILDELIRQFGCPVFCKIDVEGYEWQVLKGLSQPIPFLSFEFNPETISSTLKCIDYLKRFSIVRYNFSSEAQGMWFSKWLNDNELLEYFDKHDNNIYGDVYARMV